MEGREHIRSRRRGPGPPEGRRTPIGWFFAALVTCCLGTSGCLSSHPYHAASDAAPASGPSVEEFLRRVAAAYCEGLRSCVGAERIWSDVNDCVVRDTAWGRGTIQNPLFNPRALEDAARRGEVYIDTAAADACFDAVRESCLLSDRSLLREYTAPSQERCREAVRAVTPSRSGEACQWDWQCEPGHECYGGGCGEYDDLVASVQCCAHVGACRPLRGPGMRCLTAADCGPAAAPGFIWDCTRDSVCMLLELAAEAGPGEPCGYVPIGGEPPTLAVCASGLVCSRVADGSAGECVRPSALGAACPMPFRPPLHVDTCEPGLVCDGGACVRPNIDALVGGSCDGICDDLHDTRCDYDDRSRRLYCARVGLPDGRCGGSGDCLVDEWCDAGRCRPDRAAGGECTGPGQCASDCCVSTTPGRLLGQCI